MLEKQMRQNIKQGHKSKNWDLIKQKITTAKVKGDINILIFFNRLLDNNNFQQISDALSVLKYEVNNKKVNVLRPLGEGGYSQVYEVYDQVWITGLKYSCTHNYKFDSRIRPFML